MNNFKTNGDLFTLLRENNLNISDYKNLTRLITNNLKIFLPQTAFEDLQYKVSNFTKHLKSRWTQNNRDNTKFIKANETWLKKEFEIPDSVLTLIPSSSRVLPNTSKSFEDLSERHKRRKTQEIRNNPQMIDFIVNKQLKSDDVKFIYNFLQNHPEHVKQVRQFCEEISNKTIPVDKTTALATFVSAKLTRHQYNIIRDATKLGSIIWPSYFQIQKAKRECLPELIEISDDGVKVSLQSLLNHTALRFTKLLNFDSNNSKNLIMISKWGCDGASDQSRYKINFSDPSKDDSSVFISSLVPIKIYNSESNEILWQNNYPSSTRFCRPILFKFVKEEKNEVQACMADIQNQISLLTPSVVGEDIFITHKLLLTMVDNKICNILTDTSSSMNCYICNASPKQMNNINAVKTRAVKMEHYSFGLSSLHCWIRCFECLLHISYRLDIKCWAVRNKNDKEKVDQRKKNIQSAFKVQTGLLIDVVKQGKGTSNDGNTARKFFGNAQLSAEITGLDKNLIIRFSIILQAIASGKKINISKFTDFAFQTAKLYVSLYPWYYMPASVHKLLLHGGDIIQHAIIPIGQLSEDAQEANHKCFRKYRENHSRKMSRKYNNTDIFNNLLIASDPIISSSRKCIESKTKELSDDVKNLLDQDDNEI